MFGTIKTSARPATGDEICLIRAASRVHRGIEIERPVDDAADDLPAIGHLGQNCAVERGRHFGLHHLDRGQHGYFRQVDAECARETDRVLADVALLVGVGRDIQRDVADDEAARIGRHRHHHAVADQSPGAQFRFLLHDRVQKHVGVQAALHQRRNLTVAGGDSGLQRRVLGTVRGHDPALGDVEVRLIRDLPDLGLGAEQHGQDQPGLGGLHRAGQRIGAAWVHHAGQHRLETSTAFDKPFEPMLRHLVLLPRRRCQNFQDRGGEDLTRRVGALAVQHDDPLIRPLLPHDEPRRHRRADRQCTFDLHRGCADRGPGSRKG